MRHGGWLALASAALVTAGLLGASGASATPSGYCSDPGSFSGTVITWVGGASGSWDTASNWSPAVVPGESTTFGTYANQYVCIGASSDATVTFVTAAEQMNIGVITSRIAGFDIAGDSELIVGQAGRLYAGAVTGPSAVRSVVETGATVQVAGGLLGGNSPIEVDGTLELTAQYQPGSTMYPPEVAAALISSECDELPTNPACQPTPPEPVNGGTVNVTGTLLVDGEGYGGVNVSGLELIDLKAGGALDFTHDGYFAMDNGTELDAEPGSAVNFEGSGGIYPGNSFQNYGPAMVEQEGSTAKTDPTQSVVDVAVDFSQLAKASTISVASGGQLGYTGQTPPATVHGGATYGTASCPLGAGMSGICPPVTTASLPQIATIKAGQTLTGVQVSVHGSPSESGAAPIGDAIHIDSSSSRSTAARLTFVFDATLPHAKKAPTLYQGRTAVPLCSAVRLSPTKHPSCLIGYTSASRKTHTPLEIAARTFNPASRWLATYRCGKSCLK